MQAHGTALSKQLSLLQPCSSQGSASQSREESYRHLVPANKSLSAIPSAKERSRSQAFMETHSFKIGWPFGRGRKKGGRQFHL